MASTSQAPDPFTKCPNCNGAGWTVVGKMRGRVVQGWSGEPEMRWEQEPEQQQCERCYGTGTITAPTVRDHDFF